ncbi:MAG: hypothetical protein KKH68_04635 [Proteobacteria bacterium]|nr:hypothetical protein [Pseudomonadota bacterium]
MEEILSGIDQREMTGAQFKTFLRQNGFAEEEIEQHQRGSCDITMYAGPSCLHATRKNKIICLPR